MALPSRPIVRLAIVSALCAVSLVALWFVFELRYIWYLDAPTAFRMRAGFALVAMTILLCWFFAPSRLLVGGLGLVALFFPIMVGLSHVPTNLGFLLFVAFVIGLLMATTHLRRTLL